MAKFLVNRMCVVICYLLHQFLPIPTEGVSVEEILFKPFFYEAYCLRGSLCHCYQSVGISSSTATRGRNSGGIPLCDLFHKACCTMSYYFN